MEISDTSKMTRQEFMRCMSQRKNEIAEKLKRGETKPAFAIGADTYTCEEWDKLIDKVDKNLEAVKEEQEKRMDELKKQDSELLKVYESDSIRKNYFMEKINGTYKESVPYGYMAKDGVISYNGVEFVCDEEKNAICLGDMSDKSRVLTIPLSGGGSLMVNRDNIGDLSKAISMFSPEDINRILRAIADDNKAQEAQNTIEEDANSIGKDAEQKIFESVSVEEAAQNEQTLYQKAI